MSYKCIALTVNREKVTFRFRKRKDDDLKVATNDMDWGQVSELAREGLRKELRLRNKLKSVPEEEDKPNKDRVKRADD